ncbi:hypothetical protein BKA69DRAFT_506969 [Paraphysoderma sedebokerense]|nr:hypothetical protein BKA69DRAFT_506969 [Paraphysoderma sedebokerense]
MTHSTTLPVKNLPPPSAPFRVTAVHLVVALLTCLGYFCFSIWHRFTNSVLYQEFAVNFSTFYVLLPSAFGYLYYFAASNNISNYKPLLRQTAIISSSLLFIWIIASALSAWVLVIQYDCVEDEVSEKGISLINYKKNFQCSLASSLIALFNTIIRIPVIAVWVYMAKKSIRKGKREEEKSRDLNTPQVKVASAQQLVCQEQSSASIIPSNTATLQASSSGNIITTDNPRTYVGYASIVFVVFGNSVFAAVDRLLNPQTAMINTLTALVNIGVIPIFVAIDRRKKFNFSFQYFIGFMATLNFLRGMTQAISSFQTIQGFPKHVLLPLISVQILLFVTCYTIIFNIISTRMTSEKHYRPFLILVQMIKWTITTNAVGLFSDVAGAGVLFKCLHVSP